MITTLSPPVYNSGQVSEKQELEQYFNHVDVLEKAYWEAHGRQNKNDMRQIKINNNMTLFAIVSIILMNREKVLKAFS